MARQKTPYSQSLQSALSQWGSRSGESLTAAQLRAVLNRTADLAYWETRLHLCQLYTHIPVPTGAARPASQFFRDCLKDEHPFVRAWAHSALARYFLDRDSVNSARELLSNGANDPAASVRARIRAAERELRKYVRAHSR